MSRMSHPSCDALLTYIRYPFCAEGRRLRLEYPPSCIDRTSCNVICSTWNVFLSGLGGGGGVIRCKGIPRAFPRRRNPVSAEGGGKLWELGNVRDLIELVMADRSGKSRRLWRLRS